MYPSALQIQGLNRREVVCLDTQTGTVVQPGTAVQQGTTHTQDYIVWTSLECLKVDD